MRLVLDNLNTHTGAALYQAFEPAEALRLLKRLEFHYTPKHGSWLNMAEIEIGVMNQQCLDRRLDDQTVVANEVAAWETQRNAEEAKVRWRSLSVRIVVASQQMDSVRGQKVRGQ